MPFCLTKELTTEFLKRIKSGQINPAKLVDMTSTQRRDFFAEFLGKENAKQVNTMLESKLILKNQQKGMIAWAKQIGGLKEPIKRDILTKIEKMDELLNPLEEDAFLEDLVEKRLGIGVSLEEAETISKMAKVIEEKKGAVDRSSPNGSPSRLEYGWALTLFQDYIADLKVEARKDKFIDYVKNPGKVVVEVASASKSLLASLDNSFYGRQAIGVLFTNPEIWVSGFVKSWRDISRSLKGQDALNMIKADVFSRENAMNGEYAKGEYALGLLTEEAFPSSLPEKIPVLGKLFKASETAFNGGAIRMRADLADKLLQARRDNGMTSTTKKEAVALGTLVNSMTGRGSIGKAAALGKEINVLMFSIRFLKANFDTLTAHQFDAKATPESKKIAAKNILKIVGSIAFILGIANLLDDDSVDFDPRSSDFGKVKSGDTRFDITGGRSSLIVLASRLVPTNHNGEWGLWAKSATSGNFSNLTEGKFGQRNALDVFQDFWTGKFAPTAGVVRDVWRGEDFQGNEMTPLNIVKNLTVPIPVMTYAELKDNPASANIWAAMILEGIGISANTYSSRASKSGFKGFDTSSSGGFKGFDSDSSGGFKGFN